MTIRIYEVDPNITLFYLQGNACDSNPCPAECFCDINGWSDDGYACACPIIEPEPEIGKFLLFVFNNQVSDFNIYTFFI